MSDRWESQGASPVVCLRSEMPRLDAPRSKRLTRLDRQNRNRRPKQQPESARLLKTRRHRIATLTVVACGKGRQDRSPKPRKPPKRQLPRNRPKAKTQAVPAEVNSI